MARLKDEYLCQRVPRLSGLGATHSQVELLAGFAVFPLGGKPVGEGAAGSDLSLGKSGGLERRDRLPIELGGVPRCPLLLDIGLGQP